jgi:hypothetical protein
MELKKKVPWRHYLWPEQAIDQVVDLLVVEHGLRYVGRDMLAY